MIIATVKTQSNKGSEATSFKIKYQNKGKIYLVLCLSNPRLPKKKVLGNGMVHFFFVYISCL